MPSLYYYCRKGNFGDSISSTIVAGLLGRPIHSINGRRPFFRASPSRGGNMMAIGSILHLAGRGDVVWGTGINTSRFSYINREVFPHRHFFRSIVRSLDIRAVRGPLTKSFLESHFDAKVPAIYGDPAILLPDFFPMIPQPKRRVGVIPHYRDLKMFKGDSVISPLEKWEKVVRFIIESELVVASSLHGIIVAESYGVPARWLRNERLPSYKSESAFKFNDYYLSSCREPDQYATSVEEAVRIKGLATPRTIDKDKLRSAFPFDCFVDSRFSAGEFSIVPGHTSIDGR